MRRLILYFGVVGPTSPFLWQVRRFSCHRSFSVGPMAGPCVKAACIAEPVLGLAASVLPDFATGWIHALRLHPIWLGSVVPYCHRISQP